MDMSNEQEYVTQVKHIHSTIAQSIRSQIIGLQDENGCWNVLSSDDKYYPRLNYYVPNYKSTLWTLVLLADIKTSLHDNQFQRPLSIIATHFFDTRANIYSIGKSHFPIPCLNGNMLYLHAYFRSQNYATLNAIIDFFNEYQRFDDGDFKTPASFPYYSNRSCYGKHTCYWGIVKLLKGLSFIPEAKRSPSAKQLIGKCIDFILLHNVCYSSHTTSEYLHKQIQYITFPNMYKSDFLEILWLLKRERVRSKKLTKALHLLVSKRGEDTGWKIERKMKDLIIPIDRALYGNELVTDRAKEILAYYQLT